MASNRFSRLVKIFTGTNSGADEELLQLEGRLERFVHFWTLVARHFVRNRCLIRASALAYTTLLALIPLLAVAVGITSSLLKSQGEDKIYQAIDKFVSNIMPPATFGTNGHAATLNLPPGLSVVLTPTNEWSGTNFIFASTNAAMGTNVFAFATTTNFTEDARVVTAQKEVAKSIHDYIQNAQSGKLGLTGMIVFVFIAIAMLRRVEETFNDIWGVTRGRNWWHQISNYFTIVALGPVLLIAATSLTSGHYLHTTKHLVEKMPFFGSLILQFLPLMVLWLTFALFYQLVPNTRVKFSAAFVGGAIAGTLWHLNNVFAFLYVSRVITNSEIYGKLGLVPVFMLGLYFSWVILLFGAQVAYAFQNRAAYLQDKIADNVNQRGREFVALRIMTLLGQRFQNGLKPATVIQLSTELGVPSRLAQQILRTLAAAHLVTEVAGAETAYVPARPLDAINAHHVLIALRTGSGRELPVDNALAPAEIYGEFARIEAAERVAAEKISMLALVQRALALPAPEADGMKKRLVEENYARIEKISEPEKIGTPAPPENFKSEILDLQPEAQKIAPAQKTVRPEVIQPDETEFPL